jgi:hypothetical protein
MRKGILVLGIALLSLAGCKGDQPKSTGGTITSMPMPGTKVLTLLPSAEATVEVGGTSSLIIAIKREGFDDPVAIDIVGLPEGVAIVETDKTITKDADKKTFTLKAESTAKKVKGVVLTITAKGGAVEAASKEIKLNVAPTLAQEIEELIKEFQPQIVGADQEIEALKKKALAAEGETKAALEKDLAKVMEAREALKKYLDAIDPRSITGSLPLVNVATTLKMLENAIGKAKATPSWPCSLP